MYEILQTLDFRGTLGLRHKGDIIEITDKALIEQLLGQRLIRLVTKNMGIPESKEKIAILNVPVQEDFTDVINKGE